MLVTENIWRLSLGASVIGPEDVSFRIWAPEKDSLYVNIVSGKAGRRIRLQRDEKGYFTGSAEGVKPGDYYLYDIGNGRHVPDPASRSQPTGVHAGSEVIDPSEFLWEDNEWENIPWRDFIIYEMHVGTFTGQGTFGAIIPRLDYLADLGITAIELMPVAQFPGGRNWGYDGVYPYAPQNTYGGPKGLKSLINACHKRGIAVILDVVYNHLGPEGNYLAEFGPYFTDKYKTPWGQAFNFDGPYSDEVRNFFIENALYWATEYHIDALRLDAVHGIFDFSARHFLEELSDAIHAQSMALGRNIYLIAESDLNNSGIIKPRGIGGYGADAQWNDDFHHALHAIMTGERMGYYEDFGRIGQLEKSYREGYVYTGQYSPFRKRRHGNDSRDRRADQFIVFSQSHDQVGNRAKGDRLSSIISFEMLKVIAGSVILSPFIPLLFMGEEYGETAPFLYFISHSDSSLARAVREGRMKEFAFYCTSCESRDPQDEKCFLDSKLDMGLSSQGNHKLLHLFYRRLIRIRRESPALRNAAKGDMETRSFEPEQALFIKQWLGINEAFSFYNFGNEPVRKTFTLPEGLWELALESSSVQWGGRSDLAAQLIDSDDSGMELHLNPYSFVLYKKI